MLQHSGQTSNSKWIHQTNLENSKSPSVASVSFKLSAFIHILVEGLSVPSPLLSALRRFSHYWKWEIQTSNTYICNKATLQSHWKYEKTKISSSSWSSSSFSPQLHPLLRFHLFICPRSCELSSFSLPSVPFTFPDLRHIHSSPFVCSLNCHALGSWVDISSRCVFAQWTM